jgi:hypothetical protein
VSVSFKRRFIHAPILTAPTGVGERLTGNAYATRRSPSAAWADRMLIADDLTAILRSDRLNARILGTFADGMADSHILDVLPGVTLADVVTALDTLVKGDAAL